MRTCVLLSCIALGACASQVTETTHVAAPAGAVPQSGSAASAAPSAASESEMTFTNVAEVDIESYAEGRQVCEREATVGSRIHRERCFVVSGAEKDLLEAQTRYEIDYARQEAMHTQQQRIESQTR